MVRLLENNSNLATLDISGVNVMDKTARLISSSTSITLVKYEGGLLHGVERDINYETFYTSLYVMRCELGQFYPPY